MKRKLLLLVLLAGFTFVSVFYSVKPASANQAGSPTSRTGSPFDVSSCTFCHTGTATTTAGMITSNIPVAGYMPGNTYTITAIVTQASRLKFGFEISPQSTTGARLGTMIATSPTETQIIGSGKWITHRLAGTAGSGTRTWTFDWTAPALNSGVVTFYGAFNASNSSGNTSGDIIKLSTMAIPQDPTAGIFDQENISLEMKLFPNPVLEKVNIEINLPADGALITIQDIAGRKIKEVNFDQLVRGQNQIFLNLEELNAGIYFITSTCDNYSVTKKFLKR